MLDKSGKSQARASVKNYFFFGLKLVVSAGLVWLLMASVDVTETLARLKNAHWPYLLIAAAVLFTQTVTNTLRWKAVLEAIGRPLLFSKVYKIVFIGLFFNQTLPSAVGGDAVRIYLTSKSGTGVGKAANSVLIERVVTVLVLVLLVAFTQPFLLSRIDDTPAKWVFPALAVAAISGTVFLMFLDKLPENLRRWKVIGAIAALGEDTRALFKKTRQSFWCLIWSLYGHINLSLIAFLIGLSLGLDISILDCLVLVPPVILVMTIPISIAGWGVREGAMVVAFGMIGIERVDALSLSIIFGLLTIAIALPGGLVWLLSTERKSRPDSA